MNTYQRALRDLQDFADDVGRANYRTVDDALQRFASTMVPGTPIGDLVGTLPPVDFHAWLTERKATMGGMVGSATLEWPADKHERLAMQVELIRRMASGWLSVIDFSHTFMWVSSTFDDNISEFVQQVFRPFQRDFLRFAHDNATFEAGLRQKADLPPESAMGNGLALFISHGSADADVARALITLFEKSLKLSARDIRCTSVDGYRLPAGADTNEVLRTEVFGARLFVALLTPASLTSAYVLFELGARWGARRPLFPILASGATASDLRAPLNGLNALSASNPDQVRQLAEDAATALSQRLEPMASFSAAVDALVVASNTSAGAA